MYYDRLYICRITNINIIINFVLNENNCHRSMNVQNCISTYPVDLFVLCTAVIKN